MPRKTVTDRLVLELQGRQFTLALQPAGGGFPVTGSSPEDLATVWPKDGVWELVAIDQLTGEACEAKPTELRALLAARRALDRGDQ